jgi:hypothetical protein
MMMLGIQAKRIDVKIQKSVTFFLLRSYSNQMNNEQEKRKI